MKSTDQELIHVLKAAVYSTNLKELGNIDTKTKISELGLDSVAVMEVIGLLEEDFSIRIKDEEVAALSSVGDLLNLVRRLPPSEQSAPVEIPHPKQNPAMAKATPPAAECWNGSGSTHSTPSSERRR